MANQIFKKIKAKVTRAEQNIQDFNLGMQTYIGSSPYVVAIKDDLNAGQRIHYVKKIEPLPDDLAAIAADVLQNLRNALNNLAYQLVLAARGGAAPNWKVYYPIAGSATYYKATRMGVIKGVGQPVIDAIDATEPYKGGKGHALWQLKELANSDKHEILVGTGGFYAGFDIMPGIRKSLPKEFAKILEGQSLIIRPADNLSPMKVGDELLRQPLNDKVENHPRLAVGVSFYKPGVIEGEPAIKTLKDMGNLVGAIIDAFEPFFP